MNIRCPQCQTVFRVDPQRIPPSGAKARCARCGARFVVGPPARSDVPSGAGPASGTPSARPEAASAPPAAAGPPRERPAPAAASAAVGEARSEPAAAGVSPLGRKDPSARAERLARALVSDIVAYHPERRDKSLAEGTLRSEFRDEIMKSWEEYVAQVGMSMAKSTPYFREALNKILAKGQQLF